MAEKCWQDLQQIDTLCVTMNREVKGGPMLLFGDPSERVTLLSPQKHLTTPHCIHR